MKFNNDPEWLKRKAEAEDGCFVSAGLDRMTPRDHLQAHLDTCPKCLDEAEPLPCDRGMELMCEAGEELREAGRAKREGRLMELLAEARDGGFGKGWK